MVSVILGNDQYQFGGAASEIIRPHGLTQDMWKGLVENGPELFDEGPEFASLPFAPLTL